MKFVPDWRECWKWLSVQLSFVLVALVMVEPYAPELFQYLPQKYHAIIGVLIVLGRIVDQHKRTK